MMQFVIAAPRSGSGKTTVTCALLAALKKRGMDPCAFKSGPDYIDPMFHRSVLGVESHNLDLYLSAKNTVRELYAHYAAGHGAVVCEGAMGFYDGQGLTTRASAWELADALDLPVLLVVQPKGASEISRQPASHSSFACRFFCPVVSPPPGKLTTPPAWISLVSCSRSATWALNAGKVNTAAKRYFFASSTIASISSIV